MSNVMDTMFEDFKAQVIEQAAAANKATIEGLEKENSNLKDINTKLLKAAKQADVTQKNFLLMNLLIEKLKKNVELADGDAKANFVYEFLDCLFDRDFREDTYEVPIWLGCVTQYYTNRETIIEILRALEFNLPNGIENFRLPHKWTEEELDVFFEHMGNHVNCNNSVFKNNLRFWKPNALRNPTEVCKEHFSEVPWQYILRNPLLKKEKYLTKIGKMFCTDPKKYKSDQWLHFAHITEYLELTDDEIKTIINNIDYVYYNGKNAYLNKFLFNNIHLIEDETFLAVIYKLNCNSYEFRYNNVILKLPYKFIKQYVKDTTNFNLEWLKKNKDHFTKEQLRELTLAAMEADE